jgi:chloride channel 3/4/5
MKPGKNDPPLTVIDLSTVTIGSLREVVEETDYFGFPCVMSKDSQLLAGFVTRKDVLFLLGEDLWIDYVYRFVPGQPHSHFAILLHIE